MQNRDYRVLLVDDQPIVRRGLRELFGREPGFEVCGEADEADGVLPAVRRHKPDLVLVDQARRGGRALEVVRRLHEADVGLPVLVLSQHDERFYARRALQAGARGYLMKQAPEDEIIRAARDVTAGRVYVSAAVRRQMRDENPHRAVGTGDAVDRLTDREREVFHFLGEGYAPRHIAEALALSVSTVEVYRQRLKQKLGLESAALLQRFAVRWHRDRA